MTEEQELHCFVELVSIMEEELEIVEKRISHIDEVKAVMQANPGMLDLYGTVVGSDFYYNHLLPVIGALTQSDMAPEIAHDALMAMVEVDDDE